jgi:hypothetical protein
MDIHGNESAKSGRQGKPRPAAFARLFLTTLVLGLTILVLVNVMGNAQGIFPSPFCPAQTDRATMARKLEELCREGRGPQVLILGSSRTVGKYPEYIEAITHKRAFNAGVVSGTIVDSLATFRYARRLGAPVELLVLEIEEGCWAWNGEVGEFQLQLMGNRGLFSEVPSPEKCQIIARVFPALNLRSTWDSCGNLAGHFLRSHAGRSSDAASHEIVAGEDRTPGKTANFERNIQFQLKYRLKQWLGRRPRNERWLGYFEDLLATAKASHIEVRAFFPPLHPRWEEAVYATPDTQRERREFVGRIRALCAKYGAECKDFSDVTTFGGKTGEFIDGTHQSWINLRRMTNALFDADPERVFTDVREE